MLASGDWIIPRIAGVPCTEKPPLTYWVIATAMTLLAEDSELAVRCYGAAAAILTALLIAVMGTRWFGPRVGLVAGLMQLSTWYILQIARLAESDSLLVATVCGAMLAFALAQVDSPHGRRTDRWLPWAFYLAAGLAFLTKGLIGPVVIFSACGLYLLLSWELRGWRFLLSPIGLAIFAVCLLGWPIAAYLAYPAFLDDQLQHHFGRFRGDMNLESGRKPPFFYLYSILLVMLPWTPLVALAAFHGVRQRVWAHPWWRLAFCWIVPGLALLTASAWKHQHYSAPLLPPLSIVAALGFWQYLARRHAGRGPRPSWLAAAVATACARGVTAVQIWPPRGAGPITVLIAIVGMASLAVIYCEHRRWPAAQTTALFATVWLAAAGALTLVMPYHDSYRDHADFAAAVSAEGARRPAVAPVPIARLANRLLPAAGAGAGRHASRRAGRVSFGGGRSLPPRTAARCGRDTAGLWPGRGARKLPDDPPDHERARPPDAGAIANRPLRRPRRGRGPPLILKEQAMSCCICGEAATELVTQGEDFEYATRPGPFYIVRCLECGHVYLDPLPTAEEFPLLYPRTYYTLNPDSPNAIKGFILKMQTRMGVRRTMKFMEGVSPESVVDIGCGNADRLLRLAEVFTGQAELIGVDLRHDPSTVAAAKRKGVALVEGNVEHDLSALRDDGHDFIILSQVIEHLREPGKALRALAGKLSPGGRLLIETPNVGGLDYRLFKRRYWGHWHIPRHLNLFTRDSLGELVTQSGLSVVELGYLPSPGPWILSLRNLLGLNSVKRTRGSLRSLGEFISISNLFVVSAFTLLDFATLALGLPTSNQFLLAAKAPLGIGGRAYEAAHAAA